MIVFMFLDPSYENHRNPKIEMHLRLFHFPISDSIVWGRQGFSLPLRSLVQRLGNNSKIRGQILMSIIIAISGGSGSGKSLLSAALQKELAPEACVLSYDSYNRDQSALPYAERFRVNFDTPEAYDGPLFIEALKKLKAGQSVEIPHFDYPSHTRKGILTTLESRPIIIAEGFLLFSLQEAWPLFDYTIFVDASDSVRFARRLERDQKERGYSREQIRRQYDENVRPGYEKYIAPYRSRADFVFLNNGADGLDPVQFSTLLDQIKSIEKK
jgi:uridine kinase